MARTNVPNTVPRPTTHEGAPAYQLTAEKELRRTVMACLLWEDTFYESGVKVADRIAGLIPKVKPEALAALAIEARQAMHLRHVPLWLAVQAARLPSHRHILQALIPQIVQRADELTELLSLYWKDGKVPLAAGLKRGLAQAFGKFDAYALGKYDRANAVRLRDVLFLSHAKPKDEQQSALWKSLVDGTLPVPDTWEVALSAGADKKATWERLIAEQKLGAFALLRNLRNMVQVDVPETVIAGAIAQAKWDKILPFRFVAAARAVPRLEGAIEPAMLKALEGATKLSGNTVLLIDVSGSMDEKLSAKSDLTRIDAACALAVLLREICPLVRIASFSNQLVEIPARRGFALMDAIRSSQPHSGTYTENAKRVVDTWGYDRLILLTDEQSHQALSAPTGKGYCLNVGTYQNGVGYGAWTHIDGWSESVVTYIQALEAQSTQ